jgi:hypothetical protein
VSYRRAERYSMNYLIFFQPDKELLPEVELLRLTLAAGLGLLGALLLFGCGGDQSKASTATRHQRYFQELKKAAAPLLHRAAVRAVNRTTAAGEYPQAARAFEAYLPELRAYLKRLERLKPPPSCRSLQAALERVQRSSIQIFTGALPLYRQNLGGLLRVYMQRAQEVLAPTLRRLKSYDTKAPC